MNDDTSESRIESHSEGQSERRGLRKGLYLIPSAFTAANIGMGFFAIMGTMRGFQLIGIGGAEQLQRAAWHFDNAACAIGFAVLFDMLDGRIARMTRTTTEFGVQFDSIADMLTFGIAPALLAYCWSYGSVFADGSGAHKFGWFVSFMFVMCGAFRLARFNVQATRPRPLAEGTAKLDKKSFVGLPTPPAAGLIAAIIHFTPMPLVHLTYEQAELYGILIIALVLVLGLLMVSTVRYTSFKSVGMSRGRTPFIILVLAAIGMLVWLYSHYVLLALAIVYVAHGLVLRVASYIRARTGVVARNA
ncbi:MAG: CDP-alcohol phosphatidyltransferase family protein [Pyrinomonadaceae bacterium MAG19_C2-C3]|nr:CDP-alcohol phosphatidyltransferase family protein [Pyrinomonadaceae bacterium MAG19_C2-C3]